MRLNRAKWVGRNRIRLRFDPFAYRYIRLKVLARDGHVCYWCGDPGDTMDHIIPWSKGGRTTMDNCICACSECNGLRGDMPAMEFARLRGVPLPRPVGTTPPPEPVRMAMGGGAMPVPCLAPAVALAPAPVRAPAVALAPTPVRAPAPRRAPAPDRELVAIIGSHAIRDLLDPCVRPMYRQP